MAKETERKFLVEGDEWRAMAGEGVDMVQGYLALPPGGEGATVRVRVAGQRAWLTIKGPTAGAVRDEWEYAIPAHDAIEMLRLAVAPALSKTRYRIAGDDGLTWEIDTFHGPLEGLVTAEVEFAPGASTEIKSLPAFVGEEVTGNPAYYNAALSERLKERG